MDNFSVVSEIKFGYSWYTVVQYIVNYIIQDIVSSEWDYVTHSAVNKDSPIEIFVLFLLICHINVSEYPVNYKVKGKSKKQKLLNDPPPLSL